MTMNTPIKPTDYSDLEGQPVVFATRTAPGTSGWVPNVAYMVAGAAIFFLGAACALLAAPHPHIAARGAGAGALASTRMVTVFVPFPWFGKSGEWDSWREAEKTAWCSRHEDDTYNRSEQEEFDRHCARRLGGVP